MKEKGELYFENNICNIKREKAKVKAVGKTLNMLTLLVAISKCLAERISKERE